MLKGEHVILRPLQMEDLPARLAMVNHPDVQRMVVGVETEQNTISDLESWYELVSTDPFSEQWAIDTLDGQYIGDIDLHSVNVVHGEAWISPMVGNLAYLANANYRREAIALIASYAFQEKNVDRLFIDMPGTDVQGLQIVTQLGFQQVDESSIDFLTGVHTITLKLQPEDLSWSVKTEAGR